jgi:hypothetical protein
MRTGEVLRLSLRDFYDNSWRLLPVNALLGLVLVFAVFATLVVHVAIVLLVLAGPIAAALVHCAVVLVRDGSVTLADARDGLRLHWKRGLALGAGGAVLIGLALLAVVFYSRSPILWPLAFCTVYVLILLGLYQIVLWTLAIAEPGRPLRTVARDAALLAARRPGTALLLGFALLLVNVVGIAAAVMPFLTLTIAYTFIAAAHFALPRTTSEARP